MFLHYLKTALRHLRKQGLYTWINIAGLAIGLAISALILLFVVQEYQFDREHPAAERIYRIAHEVTIHSREIRTALTPGPLAPSLAEQFPGVEASCRLYRKTRSVTLASRGFREERLFGADPSCTTFFGIPFVQGDADTALRQPQSIVLTEAMADKYFGTQAALGKVLMVAGTAMTVTGVVEDISHRSHLRFDFLAPLDTQISTQWKESWSPHIFHSYLRLQEGAEADDLRRHIETLVSDDLGPRYTAAIGKSFPEFLQSGQRFDYFLQPVTGIHLDSHLDFEMQTNGDRTLVYSLIGVAFLVLLIAVVNYLNLTTARASKRSREVALRKSFGAEKSQLMSQFLVESLLTTVAAGVLAALFLLILWKPASEVIERDILIATLTSPWNVLWVTLGLGFLALVSGLYPSLVLSSYKPMRMLRSAQGSGTGKGLRRVIVVGQFAIAMVLMVVSFTIHRQIDFLTTRDLGFEADGLLAVEGVSSLGARWTTLKEQVTALPSVVSASAATSFPGLGASLEGHLYPGTSTRQEDLLSTWIFETDADFLETLNVRLTAGQDFSSEMIEAKDSVLVNSLVAEQLAGQGEIGKLLTIGKVPATVRGIFEDIAVQSLYEPIRATVIRPLERRPRVLIVRVTDGQEARAALDIEDVWSRLAPEKPFEISIPTQDLKALYQTENRLLGVISAFSLAAVFLACLGIFGLSAFSAEQRTREVGIRKTMGATAVEVTALLSQEFFWLVLLSFVVSVPFAWYTTGQWLQSFAFRVDVPWWLFLQVGGLILGLSLGVVGVESMRAASANPADSLKYE